MGQPAARLRRRSNGSDHYPSGGPNVDTNCQCPLWEWKAPRICFRQRLPDYQHAHMVHTSLALSNNLSDEGLDLHLDSAHQRHKTSKIHLGRHHHRTSPDQLRMSGCTAG